MTFAKIIQEERKRGKRTEKEEESGEREGREQRKKKEWRKRGKRTEKEEEREWRNRVNRTDKERSAVGGGGGETEKEERGKSRGRESCCLTWLQSAAPGYAASSCTAGPADPTAVPDPLCCAPCIWWGEDTNHQ